MLVNSIYNIHDKCVYFMHSIFTIIIFIPKAASHGIFIYFIVVCRSKHIEMNR